MTSYDIYDRRIWSVDRHGLLLVLRAEGVSRSA